MISEAKRLVALPNLPIDGVARVVDVDAQSDDAARLKALGICVDRKIQLMKAGDPLIVRVVGTRVGLSARLAEAVRVEPV